MSALTIVMYHYVRPIRGSAWPEIRGRELQDFEGQLDYIAKHYEVVSCEQVIQAHRGGSLPKNALLLTFDDGYVDHYQYAFPALKKRGWSGAFFVPAGAVMEGTVLDVNKIHFVLASGAPVSQMIELIHAEISREKQAYGLEEITAYEAKYRQSNRFDTADVIYLKRMLQVALPVALRKSLINRLFTQYVEVNEKAFAKKLYMSREQLMEMHSAGMTIGGHGYNHFWLNQMSAEEQAAEIDKSVQLLQDIGIAKTDFTFCYPYGGYNSDTLRTLQTRGCGAAFTTVVGLADSSNPLELARLDTNDLPISAQAPIAEWTKLALSAI